MTTQAITSPLATLVPDHHREMFLPTLFGLPLLHVYLFSVWLGLIVAVAWIVERGAR